MHQLKALYYPWVAIQKPETLKKALLYFDKVLLLCDEDAIPEMRRLNDQSSTYGSRSFSAFATQALDRLEEFLQETRLVRDQGILEFVSPREIMDRSEIKKLIYATVMHDLTDAEYREHIPRFSVFADDYGLIDIGNYGGYAMLDYFSIDFYDFYHRRRPSEHIQEVYIPTRYNDRGLGVAHFVQSFAVAQALYAGTYHHATLFTDDKNMQYHLYNKLRRLFSAPEVRSFLSRYLESVETRGGFLASRLLEALPDLSIGSYEDILEVRSKAGDEFKQFRAAIEGFAASIRSLPTSEDFDREVDEIIRSKINPAIVELRMKLRTAKSRTVQRLLKRAMSGKIGIPFALSIFSGLPVEAALVASLVLLGLDVYVDTYFELRDLREANTMSFLLNFE